jgi:hypothetical protein
MDDWDDDVKSPAEYGYGYNYGQGERDAHLNRPGSSRNVAMHADDEDEPAYTKRDSGETLRGEESIRKVAPSNPEGGRYDQEDDHTPRI